MAYMLTWLTRVRDTLYVSHVWPDCTAIKKYEPHTVTLTLYRVFLAELLFRNANSPQGQPEPLLLHTCRLEQERAVLSTAKVARKAPSESQDSYLLEPQI